MFGVRAFLRSSTQRKSQESLEAITMAEEVVKWVENAWKLLRRE